MDFVILICINQYFSAVLCFIYFHITVYCLKKILQYFPILILALEQLELICFILFVQITQYPSIIY